MIRENVTIINNLGLHARAASKLVGVTSLFTSQINIVFNGQVIDGKSIMAVMMLAAGKGSNLELVINGEDESQARDAICSLINNYFGERQ